MTDVLPDTVAVFPLSGALLLPRGHLPLNIFEPRYLNMVDDAFKSSRMIGMVQPKVEEDEDNDSDTPSALYTIGCLGRITSFHETEDGRYMISLTGVSRFKCKEELSCDRGYRLMEIETDPFAHDMDEKEPMDESDNLDWTFLYKNLDNYFKRHALDCDIEILDEVPKSRLLTILSMICPFEPSEKQALLEADTTAERLRLFTKIINIAIQTDDNNQSSCH